MDGIADSTSKTIVLVHGGFVDGRKRGQGSKQKIHVMKKI